MRQDAYRCLCGICTLAAIILGIDFLRIKLALWLIIGTGTEIKSLSPNGIRARRASAVICTSAASFTSAGT